MRTRKLLVLVLLVVVIGTSAAIIVEAQTRVPLGERLAAIFLGGRAQANSLVQINGEPIAEEEFLLRLEVAKGNLETMKSIASDPTNPFAAAVQPRLDLLEQYGPKIGALAGLIQDSVLLQEAKRRGLLVPLEEAKQYAEEIRAALPKEALQNPDYQALANTLGEERYWAEYAVSRYQRDLTIAALKKDLAKGRTAEDALQAFQMLRLQAVEEAKIEILSRDYLQDSDVSGAISYLKEYWALQ